MKNLILSFKTCGFLWLVGIVAVLVMVLIHGSIKSMTVVGRGTCVAGTLERAGRRAIGTSNNLKQNDTVLTMTCADNQYVTAQADVIIGWAKKQDAPLICTWFANGISDCIAGVTWQRAEATK